MLWTVLGLFLPRIALSASRDDLQQPLNIFSPDASLPVKNSTKSFWINTPGANVLANEGSAGPLTDDADVCIIGSGMTGVSAAYHLAQAAEKLSPSTDIKAVIFEAREFCSGATGRNGGHLTPYSFFNYRLLECLYGPAEAINSLLLENRTALAMVKIIDEHNLSREVDLVNGGHLSLIGSAREYTDLRADYIAASTAGLNMGDVAWLSVDEVESTYEASYPAVKFPAFNFWPLKFVTQLYLLANSSTPHFSLSLHTQTPVTSVTSSSFSDKSSRWTLTTPRGSVHCTHVIHATNAYASHLLPQFGGKKGIIPTRGQVIAVRSDTTINESWRASWGGLDHYWFPRPSNGSSEHDNEHPLVILGGGRGIGDPTFEQFETDDSVLNDPVGKDLRAFLPETFPGVFKQGTRPEMEWTGIMGYTQTTDPFVGPVVSDLQSNTDKKIYSGQYISAGYSGHGMPRAFSCAEAVAGMVISAIQNKSWSKPEWLPKRYLTWNRRETVSNKSMDLYWESV